jgi:hypothetical protein
MYGQTPILDLSNPQAPVYTEPQVRSLAGPCYRITVKNTITVTGASIVISKSGTQGDVSEIEPTCATPGGGIVDPATYSYYNFIATVTPTNNQNNDIIIEFDYLTNDTPSVPAQVTITGPLTGGTPYTVYAFNPTNQVLTADETITLYGARVISQ